MKRRSFAQSDQIRLQLQWLDEYASESRPFTERLFSSGPIIPLAISLILGIVFYHHVGGPSTFFIIFATIALSLFLLGISLKAGNRLRLNLVFAAACLLFFCLGLLRFCLVQYQGPDHISRLIGQHDRVLATVQGTVTSPVYVRQPDSIPWLGAQSSFYLEASRVHTAGGWKPCSGHVRVQVSEALNGIRPGNTVQLYCWLSEFRSPANPGQFNIRKTLKRRGVTVSASVPSADGVEILNSSISRLDQIGHFLQRQAADSLLDETLSDRNVNSLVSALLLGQRGDLNPAITAAFRKTGLAHFISLSGMHVGILAGSLWVLLRMAGLSKRPRAVLCIVIILIYAMVVPPRAPTMRAVFLSCFFFSSVLFRRNVSPLNTLALSAVVLLMIRPEDVFNAGWQLSFACVLGILVFQKPAEYHLLSNGFYPLLSLMKYRFAALQQGLYVMIQLLSVGIAAWVAGAPIMIYHFGTVTPLAPLWTVLTFPFLLVILYAGFAKLLIGGILPTAGALLGFILNVVSQLFTSVVTGLSHVDLITISIPKVSMAAIVIFYLLMFVLRYLPFRFYKPKKVFILLLTLSIAAVILKPFYSHWKSASLELTCLSVGHGQAIVLTTADRQHFLFDAGSITHQNITHKTILPYLRNNGISSLNGVFLSHGDMDHINALGDLAAQIDIKRVYANATLLETAQRPSVEQKLVKQLERAKIHVDSIDQFFSNGEVSIRSVWPGQGYVQDTSVSENDKSEVVLIEYAGRVILLCGDIESQGQREFLAQQPSLDVDVLVMPHHGSTTNLDEGFVTKLSPEVVIASCSKRNATNAYHPATDSGIKALYTTATDGAVTVTIKADGAISTTGFVSANK